MLSAHESTSHRWFRDVAVVGLWFVTLLVFSVFQTPASITWSGSAFLILYAAWAWPALKAAALFLVVAWLHSAVALTPSGLYWFSLFVVYGMVYAAQFRVMIRNAFQFMMAVALITWAFELVQLLLVSQIYPGHNRAWWTLGTIGLAGVSHALVALALYPSVQRWVVSEL